MNIRKKSPRSPSVPLSTAIDKTYAIYEKEGTHEAPLDAVAKHAGYKDAKNGASLTMLASLRYYGLLAKKNDGFLAVSSDFRDYKNTPDEDMKKQILINFLRTPEVFLELLDKYPDALPSDATMVFYLTKQGFADKAAKDCIKAFRDSVEYVDYFSNRPQIIEHVPEISTFLDNPGKSTEQELGSELSDTNNDFDKIPVRLKGGRRAWLQIPNPFYEADKIRLKKQIDLIISEDEDDADD